MQLHSYAIDERMAQKHQNHKDSNFCTEVDISQYGYPQARVGSSAMDNRDTEQSRVAEHQL
jgi:hypothetical protein